MKKLICILLLAAMLPALTACGAAGSTDDAAAKKIEGAIAAAAESASEQPAAAEEAPAAAEEEPAPAEEELEAEDLIGSKSGNSYSNEALGIRAEFPADWTILSDEQAAQMLGVVADSFSAQDLAAQLRESGLCYDLYAMTINQTGDNVNVVVQDLGVVYGIVIDEEKFLDMGEKEIETTFTQMGMTDIRTERESIFFAGQEHLSVKASAKYGGLTLYERLVLCKAGNYMGLVTAASLNQTHPDEILGFFSAYEG